MEKFSLMLQYNLYILNFQKQHVLSYQTTRTELIPTQKRFRKATLTIIIV